MTKLLIWQTPCINALRLFFLSEGPFLTIKMNSFYEAALLNYEFCHVFSPGHSIFKFSFYSYIPKPKVRDLCFRMHSVKCSRKYNYGQNPFYTSKADISLSTFFSQISISYMIICLICQGSSQNKQKINKSSGGSCPC